MGAGLCAYGNGGVGRGRGKGCTGQAIEWGVQRGGEGGRGACERVPPILAAARPAAYAHALCARGPHRTRRQAKPAPGTEEEEKHEIWLVWQDEGSNSVWNLMEKKGGSPEGGP